MCLLLFSYYIFCLQFLAGVCHLDYHFCSFTTMGMETLLSPHYKLEPVTEDDIITASLVWGITLGFGALTTWTAIKQTAAFYQRRDRNSRHVTPYIIMIWLEILVCLIFSIICWLYLRGIIPPSFAFYFTIREHNLITEFNNSLISLQSHHGLFKSSSCYRSSSTASLCSWSIVKAHFA